MWRWARLIVWCAVVEQAMSASALAITSVIVPVVARLTWPRLDIPTTRLLPVPLRQKGCPSLSGHEGLFDPQ